MPSVPPPRRPTEPTRHGNRWADLHHHANNVGWPTFFAVAAAAFLVFNLLFAVIYWIDPDSIANLDPPGFEGLFFFSIETLSTVGYGDMHPHGLFAHAVATVETFAGMSMTTVMTGLVFTRFSMPRSRITFDDRPVVVSRVAATSLVIRIRNDRRNTILGATARLWLSDTMVGPERVRYRRNRMLRLGNMENPDFAEDWMIIHRIDERSPLHGVASGSRAPMEASLVVLIDGTDETTSQQLFARRVYAFDDIVWERAGQPSTIADFAIDAAQET